MSYSPRSRQGTQNITATSSFGDWSLTTQRSNTYRTSGFCCCKKKSRDTDSSQPMRGADVIQKVLSNTRFSVEEVDRFHLVFNQLSESEVITQQSFKTLLEMMGIRISKQ